MQRRSPLTAHGRPGFTLIELLVTIGIIGVLASVTIVALNPAKNFCEAQNARRRSYERQIEKAMQQYLIDEWAEPSASVPRGEGNALPICRAGVLSPSCVNLDVLVPDYVAALPLDDAETNTDVTGYTVYKDDHGRPRVGATHDTPTCVASSGSGASVGSQQSSASPPEPPSTVVADSAGDVGYYTSIALGADGFPVISHYDETNDDLKVTKCGDTGCTAGNATVTVDGAGSVGTHTSIAVPGDGLPVVAYYDVTNENLNIAKCGNAACSSGNTLSVVDSDGTVGEHTSIAIGADGLPVVAYYFRTGNHLRVVKCGNAACSSGNTVTTVDALGGNYPSIALAAGGVPVVSEQYWPDTLKVILCGDAACSSGNTTTTVETMNLNGFFTSLALGADGFPIISELHSPQGAPWMLKTVKCGNAACSTGNTITTIDADVRAERTSIAVPADGLPVISYSSNGQKLRIAKCGNAACSAGNTLTTADASAGVGSHSDLTLLQSGLPVISYRDDANGDLKVLRCATPACN